MAIPNPPPGPPVLGSQQLDQVSVAANVTAAPARTTRLQRPGTVPVVKNPGKS